MNGPVGEGSKVLVVDDNAELRELQEILLKPVYDVETAECGESGLDTLDRSVDVVLLDRNMPGLSGTETAIEIERGPHEPAVAIISANPVDTSILDIPCDTYLEKPVKQPRLINTIEELVSRYSHEKKHRAYLALKTKHRVLKESAYGYFETTPEYQESLRELKLLEKQAARSGVTGASATSD